MMKYLILFVTILVFIYVSGCNDRKISDRYKDALPKTATDITDRFIVAYPDWSYYLKAKISNDEFNIYLKEFNLEINLFKRMPEVYSYDSTQYKDDDDEKNYYKQYGDMRWWNAKNESKVYSRGNENGETYATYEDGYLFFYVVKF